MGVKGLRVTFIINMFLPKLLLHLKGGIRCLQILKNRLCSGSWDKTIIIWNLRTFMQVTTLTLHSDTVSSLYMDNEIL